MENKVARVLSASDADSPQSRESFAGSYQNDPLGDTAPHSRNAAESDNGASATDGVEEIAPEIRRLVHIEAVRAAFDSSTVPMELANCYLSAKLEHGPWQVSYADDDIKLEKVRGDPLSQETAAAVAHSGACSIDGPMFKLHADFGHNYRLLLDSMPRIVVHLKKKKFGGNVTLAAGSFSLDLVQDRIDELTTAKETAIKAELEMVKARADKASAIAALPPASANSSTSSEGGLENATSATAQAQQASLQAAVSAAEATLARAEHDSRAAAAAFKQAEAAVLAAVIVVPLRASKQEHPRSNRQASVADRQGNNATGGFTPSHSSSGHLNDDDEEGFDADNLVNSVQGEILGQVALLVRFTNGEYEYEPPDLLASLEHDPYTAKLKKMSLIALAQHDFSVFNTEKLALSGGKEYEGEVYSAAKAASAYNHSNSSSGNNGAAEAGSTTGQYNHNHMSSGHGASSSSSSGSGGGGVDKVPHGQGVMRYPPPRGAPEGTVGDVYAGGFFYGKRQGLGVMQYADGSVYTGWYENHSRTGHGVLSGPDGVAIVTGN